MSAVDNSQTSIREPRPMPKGIERPPAMAVGYYDRSTPEQRAKVKEMCGLLRQAMFDRAGSNEENMSAVWTGPIRWAVEYGNLTNGNVWARIYSGDKLWAETLDADVDWLDVTLP